MTVIEKVARAMLADELKRTAPRRDFDQTWAEEGEVWLANARAALEALREPSEVMVEAGLTAQDQWDNDANMQWGDAPSLFWQAMLTAALNEPAS